jgi:hypothetical protein
MLSGRYKKTGCPKRTKTDRIGHVMNKVWVVAKNIVCFNILNIR